MWNVQAYPAYFQLPPLTKGVAYLKNENDLSTSGAKQPRQSALARDRLQDPKHLKCGIPFVGFQTLCQNICSLLEGIGILQAGWLFISFIFDGLEIDLVSAANMSELCREPILANSK